MTFRDYPFRACGHTLRSAGVLLAITLLAGTAGASQAEYDSLVLRARAGDSAPLLDWLAHNRDRLDPARQADWLQVANWAEDDAQVIAVWEGLPADARNRLPERGLLAVARSYRNLQQWQNALLLWGEILRRNPALQDARAGWIMSLADAGNHALAREQAELFVREHDNLLSRQVRAYVLRGHGNEWDQLFAATRLWEAQRTPPRDTELMLVDTLAAARVSAPALEVGSRLALEPATRRRLELDQAAELVRMAHTDSRSEEQRYRIADRALARYAELLQRWQGMAEAEEAVLQARIDRLGALLARHRHEEVISEYEQLTRDGQKLPRYARRWAASAYLSNRQAEQAYLLLEELLTATPASQLEPEDAQELFFAALESERIQTAGALAQEIQADAPYHRYLHGSPTPQPNDRWLTGQVLYGHYLQKINRLDLAQAHNQQLSANGPGNMGLRINHAETLLARDLPRAAERELKIAEAQQPTSLPLEREQAWVAQRLHEWQQFDLLVEDVSRRSPDEPATRQLRRAHQVENMNELRLAGRKGISSGNPQTGSHDLHLHTALYGPRQHEHFRPFIGFDYGRGRFEEGDGSQRIQALGVEYSRRDHWAELELSNHNARGGNRTGVRLSYWHEFDDHWRVGTDLERLSRDTPLRAIRSGVTSNQAGGYLRWYQNEMREYTLGVSTSRFSDGNRRMNYAISGKERLYTHPYLTLDLQPYLGASTNSSQDGPYYSPRRDIHLAPSLLADHVLHRYYDTLWRQQFLLGAGYYRQRGEGGGMSATAGYGQRYAANQVLDLGAMLIWGRQPYDGDQEHDLSLVFDLNYRF